MFSGFQCLNLVQRNFDWFNGFRITMRRPEHPCKFGVHINTSVAEYEHFVGHLVDLVATETDASSKESWVEYELPLSLMVNSKIQSSLVPCPYTDNFSMKGLTLHIEKQNSQFDSLKDLDETGETLPINIQIKSIDAIFNPEYEKLMMGKEYKLPIFFKSLKSRDDTYWEQGFIDNGRR